MTEEEIADRINNVVSAALTCKRIIIWNTRHLNELRKLEVWLKDEQKKYQVKSEPS
jgi:hypothetical protein